MMADPQSEHRIARFDPLLTSEQAEEMVRLCERYGTYGSYGEEPVSAGFAKDLPARYDAIRNFLISGGRFGRHEEITALASRTNYFREEYAYGKEAKIEGIDPFLFHEGFIDAARSLFGRPVIEPAIVFANLLLPGQELAIHSDVPEFRGCNRKKHPQWLLVVMHHSGLFEDYRMPIATAVSWFHDCDGGEFAFYPDGPNATPQAHQVRYNTALLLDTDSVFHGVDRVAESDTTLGEVRPGMKLTFAGDKKWTLRDADHVVNTYDWERIRFSVSWKAYCFRDEAERDAWAEHRDDLSIPIVLDQLKKDLRARGRLGDETLADAPLADLLIDEYVPFPPAQTAAA
jgi:hypothetical protein